jgi:hypothetical protein
VLADARLRITVAGFAPKISISFKPRMKAIVNDRAGG